MSHEYNRAFLAQVEKQTRMSDTRQRIFAAISQERIRQDELKAEGRFSATCADSIAAEAKLTILVEEVGEAARAVLDGKPQDLRTELIQVAAVAVAWLEAFDANPEPDLLDELAGLLGGK